MQQSTSLPGVSRLICVATKDHPRFSEADLIELTSGNLFLAVTRKSGSSDFAPGSIIGMFSTDAGRTFDDEPRVIQSPSDDLTDLMSVSLCRTSRGVHLFFLARGKDAKKDTRVYQMLSTDEAKTWSTPQRISAREGYHIVNNARVIATKSGRIVVPCAYTDDIGKNYDGQRVYCLFSDDQGKTWKPSNDLTLDKQPLMEPGIAQCANGSLYMTIRTATKKLWQARSTDDGATWADLKESPLPAPAAPSTVFRDPSSNNLWMFWCNSAGADWKGRSPQVFATSADHGKTWSEPRVIEEDPKGSFGYISVDIVQDHALLTYYDWRDNGQKPFQQTSLRLRMIPLAWLRGEITPPVFRPHPQPVLKSDQPWEGETTSVNSGVVADGAQWKMWYTNGTLGPKGEKLRVCFAQSTDLGVTWTKPKWPDSSTKDSNIVLPAGDDDGSYYHASVHREADQLNAFVWRTVRPTESGLYRFVSKDDGKTFTREPADRPLIASWWTPKALRETAGEGRISNDAFDMTIDPRTNAWVYYAAFMEKATDPRAIVKHDNCPGLTRLIARAQSADGLGFSAPEIILRPDYETGREWTQQFYGMQVFPYRAGAGGGNWWLALLHTYFAESQIIQPEWAWSHDGYTFMRTRTPAIPLGDEGAWDSRMILFGDIIQQPDELIWIYSGMDWRHNAFKKGQVRSAVGRATVSRKDLDAWLATLPQP